MDMGVGKVICQNLSNPTNLSDLWGGGRNPPKYVQSNEVVEFFFWVGGEVIRQNPSDSTNSSKLGEDRGNEVWGKVGLGGGAYSEVVPSRFQPILSTF